MDISEVIQTAVSNTLDDLNEENKKQLFEGYDKTGEKITRKYRNNKYARVKNEMNPLPGLGVPDLKLTGAYYRGRKATLSGDVITVTSSDEKAEELEAKYPDINGLGGQFKKEYQVNSLSPEINKGITAVTGLKFGK